MANLMSGKGMYIWLIPDCEGGNYQTIAQAAVAAGIKHVVIKVADRHYDYNVVNDVDLAAELAPVLKAAGIQVWGWQYTYGTSPEAEGVKGAQRALQVGVEGFIVDAESEYKTAGGVAKATAYMDALLDGLVLAPIPVGLASYRYPSLHPEFPWAAFRYRLDFDMPQVYWEQAHNPAEQLRQSYDEFQAMIPQLSYIPTGAAYKVGAWSSTPDDVTRFLEEAVAMDLQAANFWEWGRTKLYVPELWPAIAAYPWPEAIMLPKLIQIKSSNNVGIRDKPGGAAFSIAFKGWQFRPMEAVEDANGKLWYNLGPGWVPATNVTVVEP